MSGLCATKREWNTKSTNQSTKSTKNAEYEVLFVLFVSALCLLCSVPFPVRQSSAGRILEAFREYTICKSDGALGALPRQSCWSARAAHMGRISQSRTPGFLTVQAE